MLIERLAIERYRNLTAADILPDSQINVISGENAQGKTNLLESIWLFTGGKSFRGAKDRELVAFGKEEARLMLNFFSEGRSQKATLRITNRRMATLNGVSLSSPVHLTGHFGCIVFSPTHLSLIKDGPEERRKFIDAAYCQLRPGYIRILTEYQRLLFQRNALLKDSRQVPPDEALMDVLEEKLADSGNNVRAARRAYLHKLTPELQSIYDGLSSGKETMTVTYHESHPELPLRDALKQYRSRDLLAGFTTVGPHREDMEVSINGNAARVFASQGQQRSAVLALKLAEAALLRQVTGEPPVVLLDDVMSELDVHRQDYILNHIHDWQVFITCCDPGQILRMTGGKEFRLDGGVITG